MKLLTILIFSGDRLSIKDLLKNIAKLNNYSVNVKIIEWGENKEILKKKIKIYNFYKKKIKNIQVRFQKGSNQFKYKKYINTFKSKYIILIGDDDRLIVGNFKMIFKYLKYNYSGLTLSFQNIDRLKKEKTYNKNLIRDFIITKDIHLLGFTSCQIIKTSLIKKIFSQVKGKFFLTQFPQNFIIFKIISKFNNWKMLNLDCIINNVGNLDAFKESSKKYSDRLVSEYKGYFLPIKENFKNLESEKIESIYIRIFLKNIVSWLFLSLKHCGKKKTFRAIKNVRSIIKEPFVIKIILIIFYLSPFFLINLLRLIRHPFIK